MEIVAWLVLGAVAGYAAGGVVAEDGEGLGVPLEVLTGCGGGLVGGFFAAWLVGSPNPISDLDPQTLVPAAVLGTLAVVALTALARSWGAGA